MESENQSNPNIDSPQEASSEQSSYITPSNGSDDASLVDSSTSKLEQRMEARATYIARSGPIPDPDTLREYDSIVPGYGKEFLASFLEESKHRREMERKMFQLEEKSLEIEDRTITGSRQRSNGGLLAGFIVAMSALVIGGGLVYKGHDIAGGIIAGSTLPSLAAVFVTGSLKKEPKLTENRDEAAESSSDD